LFTADVSDVSSFQDSEEQRCAYALVCAYRDGDGDAVTSAIARSNALTFLDAPFARAARKLPRPGHDLKAISFAMGGDGGAAATGEHFMAGIGGGGGGGDSDLPDDDDLT
jgi:26S proteasome regulatory subunit T4